MPIKTINNPMFQAFTSTGAPLSGGKLYTYKAGTSTLKATYSDIDMETANPNPVILNSLGQAILYGTGAYKFNLTTSADVQVTDWPVDNITTSQGGDTAARAAIGDYGDDLAAAITAIGSTETTLVIDKEVTLTEDATIPSTLALEFTRGGSLTGAYTVTHNGQISAGLWQIFGPTITVNGSAIIKEAYNDWFATAQKAIDTSSTWDIGLHLGSITRNSGDLTLPDNTHILSGTVTKDTNSNTYIFTNSDTSGGNENIKIENVTINCSNKEYGGSNGIYFENVDGIEVNNCILKNYHSSTASVVKAHPLQFSDCTNVRVKDNHMFDCGRSGVFIEGTSKDVIISGNLIERVENSGITVKGDDQVGAIDDIDDVTLCRNIVITDNIIKDAHHGHYDEDTGYTGDQAYNQDGAIDVYQGGSKLVIANNLIDGFGIYGVDEQADPGGDDAADGDGIRIVQTFGALITGNQLITDDTAFGAVLYAKGRDSVDGEGVIFDGNSCAVRGEGLYGIIPGQPGVVYRNTHFTTIQEAGRFLVGVIGFILDTDNVIVENFYSDVPTAAGYMSDSGRSGINFEVETFSDIKLKNVEIVNAYTGLFISPAATMSNLRIDGLKISGINASGFGVRLDTGTLSDITIKNSIMDASNGTSGLQSADGIDDFSIIGNTFTGGTGRGIRLVGTYDNLLVKDNVVPVCDDNGFDIGTVTYSRITGNTSTFAGENGFFIAVMTNSVFADNFVNAASQGTDSLDNAVHIISASDSYIHDNTIRNGGETNGPAYGLLIAGGNAATQVNNNFVTDAGETYDINLTTVTAVTNWGSTS